MKQLKLRQFSAFWAFQSSALSGALRCSLSLNLCRMCVSVCDCEYYEPDKRMAAFRKYRLGALGWGTGRSTAPRNPSRLCGRVARCGRSFFLFWFFFRIVCRLPHHPYFVVANYSIILYNSSTPYSSIQIGNWWDTHNGLLHSCNWEALVL